MPYGPKYVSKWALYRRNEGTYEEAAVVTKIRRPPWLAVSHEIVKILLDAFIIQTLEFLSIVLAISERIRLRGVLSEDVESKT